MLAERGLTHFHWDLDPQEWKHNNAKKAYDYVTKQLGEDDRPQRPAHARHQEGDGRGAAADPRLDRSENRRASAHKRRIRIIQSYELAEERLPPGELEWLHDPRPIRSCGRARRVRAALKIVADRQGLARSR